ncbi:COG1470 family protein [Streptomyces beihaiensis]|uniref:Hydrolytic protein n=1 Tax=Streptomyces beihaiensis TaxID=2984495 RepID=A0ABT3TTW3_9ACTN|nr:hydrolytic protein [Streptomyces beihaiensis]MCX3060470.1 hydrolytic protein [Streptomyces beihaiensis]
MTPSAASSGPGAPGLDIPAVTVTPGDTATTQLTVRNDSDIVEAYSLEVVGDCAAWATVEPERVSLYPGTSETVTIRLEPPRSPEVRAGEMPLGVRVLPAEHPESAHVPETTVRVREFRELRTELAPRRRRGWLRARYRLAVRNQGNTPVQVGFTPGQAGEELAFAFKPPTPKLEPGESAEVGLRVRTGKPVWFGAPVVWPFTVETTQTAQSTETTSATDAGDTAGAVEAAEAAGAELPVRAPLDAEFVQIPVFPKWLLAVLAALLALLLAWFALVRPAVRSAAKDAADKAVQARPTPAGPQTPGADGGGSASPGAQRPGAPAGSGNGGGGGGGGGTSTDGGGGRQSSQTIDVRTTAGQTKTGSYTVPKGSTFGVTDIVVANFQGDEGQLTITFGDRKITTIALETFRNQDYHWVTPITIPEGDTASIKVTCDKPGTPATGRQAAGCHEVLNVSGVLSGSARQ